MPDFIAERRNARSWKAYSKTASASSRNPYPEHILPSTRTSPPRKGSRKATMATATAARSARRSRRLRKPGARQEAGGSPHLASAPAILPRRHRTSAPRFASTLRAHQQTSAHMSRLFISYIKRQRIKNKGYKGNVSPVYHRKDNLYRYTINKKAKVPGNVSLGKELFLLHSFSIEKDSTEACGAARKDPRSGATSRANDSCCTKIRARAERAPMQVQAGAPPEDPPARPSPLPKRCKLG